MMGRLEGKVAFITGAARGQGRADALRLAAEGADIVAFDICAPIPGRDMVPAATRDDLAETERCVKEMGRQALAVVSDTRDFTDLQGAVDAARTRFGGIDVVIANAGTIGGNALAHEISENDWQTTLDINLLGVWLTVKAALPGMIAAGRGGSIILISSAAGIKPTAHLADYGASKAAVIHLTRVLALENGVHNIRVNCIAPGTVDTPMVLNDALFRLFRPDLESPTRADVEPTFSDLAVLKSNPLLDPGDIANAVLWLASDEAAFVTGVTLPVDMGAGLK